MEAHVLLKRKNSAININGGEFIIKTNFFSANHRTGDILQVRPLGAGQEVGRSCVILKFRGKTIMVLFLTSLYHLLTTIPLARLRHSPS